MSVSVAINTKQQRRKMLAAIKSLFAEMSDPRSMVLSVSLDRDLRDAFVGDGYVVGREYTGQKTITITWVTPPKKPKRKSK